MENIACEYKSPLGAITLAADGDALAGLWLEGQKYFGAGRALTPGDAPALALARDWLDRYFAGERPAPRELSLAPAGTEFQRAVWALLCEIPYGETSTYGALARRMPGGMTSPRAVGAAVGRNPISIIIPCHRVLGADGSLTGYAGGLERKRWLLEFEGARR